MDETCVSMKLALMRGGAPGPRPLRHAASGNNFANVPHGLVLTGGYALRLSGDEHDEHAPNATQDAPKGADQLWS